jgi:CheY-like chemotaxis protein
MLIGTAQQTLTVSRYDAVQVERDPDRLIQRVRKEAFDLVLIDLMLPHLTVALLQKVFELVPRTFTVPTSFIEELTRHVNENSTLEDVSKLLVAGVAVQRRSQLVSQRSPEQLAELDRKALELAFAQRKDLLEGSLTTQAVAKLLGTSRQTPHDRVKAKTLLAIEESGTLRFPHWQFDASGPNGVVPGFSEVLKELDGGPVAQARWFQHPNRVLEGRTPLQAIKDGDLARVLVEARAVGAAAGARG